MRKAATSFIGYLKELIAGGDNKARVRAGLAVFFAGGIGFHVTYCTIYNRTIDVAAMGLLSGLIYGLLDLTTKETIKLKQTKDEVHR